MATATLLIIPLLTGYLLDLIFGDPARVPHPVRLYGKLIARGDVWLNGEAVATGPAGRSRRGAAAFVKGALLVIVLTAGVFFFFHFLLNVLKDFSVPGYLLVSSVFVFYGLANRQLTAEGKKVFSVLQNKGLDAARRQLSQIVGRDTAHLQPRQIRIAVLETLSENLSDAVIAPLFYYAIGGVPAMMTYKMINTLDSMIGYRNERYGQFGKFAARLDDVANFIPARLTAVLMVLSSASLRGAFYMIRYGHRHKSPNAGYPEATLAGILNVRLGGGSMYQGVLVEKPWLGDNDREIVQRDLHRANRINHETCLLMVVLVLIILLKFY